MQVTFKYYEPNKGYEEYQAKVFSDSTGIKVTPKEIEERIKHEKRDPKLIRYAFTEEEEFLGYCQASWDGKDAISIGYPWVTPNCPPEVQHQLFDELLEYIKDKRPKEIHYWLKHTWTKQIDFFKSKGFELKTQGLTLDFNIEMISSIEIPDEGYSHRIATAEDLDLLVEIGRQDTILKNIPSLTKDAMTSYFQNKVLKDGHAVLIFNSEGEIVCATAPLQDYPDREVDDHIILRFTATRPGYESAWPLMLKATAQECINAGWAVKPIRIFSDGDSKMIQRLKNLKPDIKPNYDLYVLKED